MAPVNAGAHPGKPRYDLEKYRKKRERVLGVRRRRPGFFHIVAVCAAAVVIGTGSLVIPQAIAYLQNRNLDDAIFKPAQGGQWTDGHHQIVREIPGVVAADKDHHSGRVVVTFDRTAATAERISAVLAKNGMTVVLLNVVGHSERLKISRKEQAFEAL